MWYAVGALEGLEASRQRRHGLQRSVVTSDADRDPRSTWMLAVTWWPAGAAGLAAATVLPRLGAGGSWAQPCRAGGILVTAFGIALRQWSIRTLGQFFVGHVRVQRGQTVVDTGPYRWLRHPSYAGQWLEMIGVGLATGNMPAVATCTLLPLVGIVARIQGEERELTTALPGYDEFVRGRARLVPFLW
jgi:protein-S-isoprenylcysteine O-methyltransferase Ste14